MKRPPTLLLFVAALVVACGSEPRREPEPAPPPPAPAPPPPPRPVEKPKEKTPPPAPPPPAPRAPAAPAPFGAADLAAARAAWARGELDGVDRALARADATKAEPGLARDAATLATRAKLARAILEPVARSPLAGAKDLEHVDLNSGRVTGRVEEADEGRLRVLTFGGVRTEVSLEVVTSRKKVGRAELEALLRDRLSLVETRTKPDDALGHYRCAWYAWGYGLLREAMPHVDATLDASDFPNVPRTFLPDRPELVAAWAQLTGKTVPAPRPKPAPRPPDAVKTGEPSKAGPKPTPAAATAPATKVDEAHALHAKGLERYRASFGDRGDMDKALKEAAKHLKKALELLEGEPDPDGELEPLKVELQSLLFDVRKRTRV